MADPMYGRIHYTTTSRHDDIDTPPQEHTETFEHERDFWQREAELFALLDVSPHIIRIELEIV